MSRDDDLPESEYMRARQIAEGLYREGDYRTDMQLRVGFAAVAFALLALAVEINRAARQIARAIEKGTGKR